MFEKQGWHFLFLLALLILVGLTARGDVLAGSLWGISTQVWLWLAIVIPIAHQVILGIIWRSELYHQWMTKAFGEQAFLVYKVIFTVLFVLRPIAILLLGVSNRGTLACPPGLMYMFGLALLVPFGYTMYSVARYFGVDRAYGIDHFEPERYRQVTLVKKGMFKYSDNAMYKFGFLVLWSIAFLTLSKAALLAAIFSHVYIWVHFYFTELPDMRTIYQER